MGSAVKQVTGTELRVARKRAQRMLEAVPEELEEVASAYLALSEKGIASPHALEAACGIYRNGHAPIAPSQASFDGLVRDAKRHPERAGGLIAGLHDSLLQSNEAPPPMRINGHAYKREEPKITPLVGYEGIEAQLGKAAGHLLFYDASEQMNVYAKSMPRFTLLHGPPGTGKSTLCSNIIKQTRARAALSGTRVRDASFAATDMSKWVGESSKALASKLEYISDPSGIGIFVFDDIDMLLVSRDNSDQTHELRVTATAMHFLQGLKSEYRGNFLVFGTTNRRDKIDGALDDRILTAIEVPGFDSKQQYQALFEREMPWGSPAHDLLSSYAMSERLSPRSAHALITRMDQARRPAIPEELYSLPVKERVRRYDAMLRPVTEQMAADVIAGRTTA